VGIFDRIAHAGLRREVDHPAHPALGKGGLDRAAIGQVGANEPIGAPVRAAVASRIFSRASLIAGS
jgi:hypothetical protein